MRLTINIKSNRVAFFLELLKNFDFVSVEKAEDFKAVELSSDHRAILDERLERYNKETTPLTNWNELYSSLEKQL